MPVVQVTLIEGYDDDARARLCAVLADAVRMVLPASAEAITVALHEVAPAAYSRGGPRTPAPALPDAVQLVRTFLERMEARDLASAQAMLAGGFEMTFPGGVRMTRLGELVDWAKGRYRFVRKTYERFDVAPGAEGPTVYCFGTLAGEWLDGSAFEGIRFIDRFETAGGRLARQHVWNDMGERRNG
ncbi:MAG: tautomerase [Alphaproteobacteria bacterium HGW-Alphaproteobacteria-2]|nr:MAG: tautomerase [Alphaproteobacteria bacterium HGW-Alphaproteobacteria-2]